MPGQDQSPRSGLVTHEWEERVATMGDVLHASPIVIFWGSYPVRIVVRSVTPRGSGEVPAKFVVHTETLSPCEPKEGHSCGFEHRSFEHGDYFTARDPSPVSTTEAFTKAFECFKERSDKLFGRNLCRHAK